MNTGAVCAFVAFRTPASASSSAIEARETPLPLTGQFEANRAEENRKSTDTSAGACRDHRNDRTAHAPGARRIGVVDHPDPELDREPDDQQQQNDSRAHRTPPP